MKLDLAKARADAVAYKKEADIANFKLGQKASALRFFLDWGFIHPTTYQIQIPQNLPEEPLIDSQKRCLKEVLEGTEKAEEIDFFKRRIPIDIEKNVFERTEAFREEAGKDITAALLENQIQFDIHDNLVQKAAVAKTVRKEALQEEKDEIQLTKQGALKQKI